MAFLIPENLKSRNDVASGIQRVARAFQVGLDEDVVVWYEPLYDPARQYDFRGRMRLTSGSSAG